MTTKQITQTIVSITAEKGCCLVRRDTPLAEASELTSAAVKADCIDDWAEVPLTAVQHAKAEAERIKRYEARVVELIRERYTADDETAILRKYLAIGGTPGTDEANKIIEEFELYNAYAEQCKAEAKLKALDHEGKEEEE